METPDEQRGYAEGMGPEERQGVTNTISGEDHSTLEAQQTHQPRLQEPRSSLVEVLANLGHEFRTPLAVITGSTSTLLRQGQPIPPEEQQEFLQMIQLAGQRLQVLTDRMFELAQLEAGTVQIEASPVDLPAVLREAINNAQAQVPEPFRDHVTFHLQCRDEAGNQTQEVPLVLGDRRALHKVLGHLLENAIRFSPQGGTIDVIVRPAPHADKVGTMNMTLPSRAFMEICVCDYGVGIPAEHLEDIFERFYQVDTSLSREVSGLGIGLTVCRYLVALHHGHLWAESCPAGGSAFHLWLPLSSDPHN